MIDKICTFLTNRIRKEMPEVDDEKAEVIFYGLQNIVGEIPARGRTEDLAHGTCLTRAVLLSYRSAVSSVSSPELQPQP